MKQDSKLAVLNVPFGTGNPYQLMMYQTDASDYRLIGGTKNFPRIAENAEAGRFAAVHIHWDDLIFRLGRKIDPSVREEHNEVVLDSVSRIKAARVPVLFTVHNARPHSPGAHLPTFTRCRQRMCDLSDVIHVHTDFAAQHIRSAYSVDESKIRLIPHPSYLGVYEDEDVTLNRPPEFDDERRFLFFGAFRRNKGIDKVVKSLDRLRSKDLAFHAMFRGKVRENSRDGMEDKLSRFGDSVSLKLDGVPEERVPAVFSSADFLLAPYSESILTSGSIMLGQTFGLPVIAPDTPAIRDFLPPTNQRLLFDPEDPEGLSGAMELACNMDVEALTELRSQALGFSRDRSPRKIASLLSHQLDCLVAPSKPPEHSKRKPSMASSSNEIVNRLTRRLSRHGFRVSPNKESADYLAGMGLRVATVFDVGVAGGTAHLYSAFPEAKFALIEPLSEYEAKLRKNWSDRIDFDFHACGVGAEDGEITLRIPSIGRRTLGTRATMLELDETGAAQMSEIEERQVRIRTLDDIATRYEPPFGLKIDTEGFELEVIKGATEMLKQCAFVIAEVSIRRRYRDGYRFSDFVSVMAQHGFELHDFVRPPSPDASDCDAVFAPYSSPLFDYRDARLSRLAAREAEA